MSETVEIRKSYISGYGVFAKENIPKGSVITTYEGRKLSNISLAHMHKYNKINDNDFCYMVSHMDYKVPCYSSSNFIKKIFEPSNTVDYIDIWI